MRNTLIVLIFVILASIFFVGCPQQIYYKIMTYVEGNGEVFLTPLKEKYLPNENIQVTACPDEGWNFDHWEGDLSGSANPENISIDSNKEATAVFVRCLFNLTLSKTGEGELTKNPSKTEYEYEEEVTLEATPNEGWSFSGWYENDQLLSQALTYVVEILNNREIEGRFTINEYTLTTNAENGTIIRTPDSGTYEYGTEVELEAVGDEGYHFLNWTGDLSGSTNPESIIVDENKDVTALFELSEYDLTLESSGNGTAAKNPVQEKYVYGTEVTLTATPDEGWQFIRWTGDFESMDNPATLLMDASKTITAIFNEEKFDLTTNIWGSGEISVLPEKDKYADGERVTINATSDANWHSVGVLNGDAFFQNRKNQKCKDMAFYATINGNTNIVFEFKPGPENDPEHPGPIIFDDANFEQAVRDLVGKPTGNIYPSDVAGIKNLYIDFIGINSLKGIEYFVDLTYLYAFYNSISNIEFLKGLYYINDLNLGHNTIIDISQLSNLINLEELYLSDNLIEDIEQLGLLTNLTELYLSGNNLEDITSFGILTNLELLLLRDNNISDISALSNLINLLHLNLWGNNIENIDILANLTNLEQLLLNFNEISDITPLENLTNLESLYLTNNNLTDISPIGNLINLVNLSIAENAITDISPLENILNLELLYSWENLIADISPLENLVDLVIFYSWTNLITDISPLENLTNLEELHLGGNQIEDISTLENLTNLDYLQLWDNLISDISPLEYLINLEYLSLESNEIIDVSSLEVLINIEDLLITFNQITDITPLVNNTGIGNGDRVDIRYNLLDLDDPSIQQQINDLQTRIGAEFFYTPQN